jgi:hypothetical protein
MTSRLRRWISGWLSPGVVAAEAPERVGPFPDQAAAERAAHDADEKHSDWLNAYLGYFEAQREDGDWYAVRVLGRTQGNPASIQRTAGLGPSIG